MTDFHIGMHWHHIPRGQHGICVDVMEQGNKLILILDTGENGWLLADVRECWPEDCAGAA